VAAHVRATKVLRDDPGRGAELVQPFVGGGRLDPDLVERAIVNSRDNFVADPHFIRDTSLALQDFQKELGTLGREVTIDELFDFSFYDELQR
jgi:NitT/TauT family transport system substrate-binding protein